ncbi:MAG: lamin tail domain-containing protein [Lentisphaerae bacterium]|nr:lamin tail domain-containing protein [Lentisphaerota bacterium]
MACGAVLLGVTLAGLSQTARADVILNEFMAANAGAYTNESGQTSDWIELYNSGSNAVDLTGWSLTDTISEPRKWVFPAGVTLGPYAYLLLMADGKTNTWINGDLHADFKLDPGGEYLGLFHPDGHTVESEFAPVYPPQGADVSFGYRPDVARTALVVAGQAYRYHQPADLAGLDWTARDYDASGWSTGSGPMGYESRAGGYAAVIQTPIASSQRGVYVRHTFVVSSPARLDALALRIKYDDGFVAYLNGVKVTGANAPTAPTSDSYAVADRPNADALQDDDFDLSASLPLLQEGTNVLAIHIMNITSAPLNTDLLLEATLDGDSFTPTVSNEWRYFHTPTPGLRNVIGDADLARDVAFDHVRGFYGAPFLLKLSTDLPGFSIRFTVDGTSPDGPEARAYTNVIPVSQTTIVRAQATRTGYEPSRVGTHTFLFTNDVIRQSTMGQAVVTDPLSGPQVAPGLLALPTLSIATAPGNLFGSSAGIYVNPEQRGEAWERPVSMEWIAPGGGPETQIDCGLRIYGDYGRRAVQKSFRVLFKGRYGASKLAFPVFADPQAVTSFDTLILRAGYNDKLHANGLIDTFVRGSQRAASGVASHATFVHLYLNGVYWGIYNPSERPDNAFGASYFGGVKEAWDSINAGYPTGESLVDTYNAMLTAVGNNISDNVQFQRVRGCNPDGTRNAGSVVHLDVDNQIDYMLTHIWAGTSDWPGKNYYAAGARVASAGWKYFVWDSEFSLGALSTDVSATGGPANIHGRLRQSVEYRLMFADHVRRHLFHGGALSPASTLARYSTLVAGVEQAIAANAARWGNTGTLGYWRSTQDGMLQSYLPQRTDVVLGQLRRNGLYPLTDAPEFSQLGGPFSNAFVLAIQSSNAVYYTLDGRDPRAVGSGAIAGTSYGGPMTLTSSVRVKARSRTPQGEWSALTDALFTSDAVLPLRISEVMADPRAVPTGGVYAASDYEYVEVHNSGPQAMNLALVTFTSGIDFTFPSMLLEAGGYAVVVRHAAAFAQRYGMSGIRVAGVFSGALDNNGERLALRASADGPVLVDFTYSNGRSWPLAAQGAGHALVPQVLGDQTGGELDYGGNWRASAYRDGSPGRADPMPVRDLVINEIRAHTDYTNELFPDYDSNDWMELYNTGAATVSLSNWYLSDDPDVPAKWAIPPSAVVTGGAWIAFDELTGFHSPITNGFGLNKAGECVVLSYLPGTALDRVADIVQFKGQERDRSLGRYPDGEEAWYALEPTFQLPNALPGERVVLSEIMYHPAPTVAHPEDNTHDEYIELHNPTDAPVTLENVDGCWRIDGGASYTFPPATVLPAGGYLLVVPFDPADAPDRQAFMEAYSLTNADLHLFGPYAGRLSNRSERVAVERPQAPDVAGQALSWVVVDEVVYADGPPWPGTTDGSGLPLQRVRSDLAGTLPGNWFGTFRASPGLAPDKVGIAQPQPGAAVFAPSVLPVLITVDAKQIAGAVERVRLAVGDDPPVPVTGPPYEPLVQLGTNAGIIALRAEMVDGSGTNWSAVTPVQVHAIDNDEGAERITDVSARLRGRVRGPGSVNLTFFWGPQDAGTNAADWERSGSIGSVSAGAYVADVAGLVPVGRYVYRCRARADRQEGWSGVQAFQTLAVTNWAHRMRVTFSGYTRGETLTNFTVLVRLGPHIPGFSYDGFTSAEGSDLRFTSGVDGSSLAYEIESWNTNGESTVWVRVPLLARPEDFMFAYWGRATANESPTYTRNGDAWEAPYRGVWHLQDAFADSSAGRLLVEFTGTAAATGIVSSARQFDGWPSFVDPHTSASWYGQNINGMTVSFWAKPPNTAPGGAFGADDPSPSKDRLLIRTALGQWSFGVSTNERRSFAVQSGVWQLVALVLRDGRAWAYRNDGAPQFVGSYTNFEPVFDPWIGALNGSSNYVNATLDEFRLAGAARSDAWIWAHYRNVASNAWFMAYEVGAPDPFDDDRDGVPDAWERRYYGGTQNYGPASDSLDDDGDGLVNADEYVAGTDPTNAASFFEVAVGQTGSVGTVEFDAIAPDPEAYAGRTRWYAVESSPEVGAPWSGVDGCTNLPSIGARITVPIDPTGAPFYRGRVWLDGE